MWSLHCHTPNNATYSPLANETGVMVSAIAMITLQAEHQALLHPHPQIWRTTQHGNTHRYGELHNTTDMENYPTPTDMENYTTPTDMENYTTPTDMENYTTPQIWRPTRHPQIWRTTQHPQIWRTTQHHKYGELHNTHR